MGRSVAEGYHLLARVIPSGGDARVVQGEGVNLTGADSVLLIMRLEYLEDASAADTDALREALAAPDGCSAIYTTTTVTPVTGASCASACCP